MCDHFCSIYGDCCSDSDFFNVAEQRRGTVNFECVQLKEFDGIYMKAECPPTWGDMNIREMCERASEEYSDPITGIPATSKETKVTYRNIYCAVCHGETKLELWKPRVECGTINPDANLTGQDVTSLLQFDEETGDWGIFYSGKFHHCAVDPVLPETMTPYVRRCLPKLIKTCTVNWTNADVRSRCEAYTSVVYDGATPYRNPHCAICNNVPLQLLQCYRIDSRDIYFRTFGPSSFSILFDLRGGPEVGKIQPCPDDELYDPFFDKCRHILDEITVDRPFDPETNNSIGFEESRRLEYYTPDNYTDYPEPCQKFLLDKSEYVLENTTIYIPMYNKYFRKGEYILRDDDSLEICSDDLGVKLIDKFSVYMGYATYAGLGISLIFLILHLVAFILVPELRNLSGKNLASLCVSLLFAYIAFMAGQLLKGEACYADAVITYYCFLASFTWMLTMSFDVWRTLRLATSELRVSAGKQWRKFTIYSLWSWLAPAVIVATAVFVDTSPEDAIEPDWRPDFGVESCWFGRRKALWAFFAGPLGVIMALNVTFFGLSARMIYSSTSTTRFTASAGTQRDFRLYARLAVIMGLTWIVGLVAGAFDIVILWYIFIGLNTLQGLFIFLAFTCTDKVIRALAHRRTDGKPLRPPSFSWSTTDSTRKSHMSDPQTTDTLY